MKNRKIKYIYTDDLFPNAGTNTLVFNSMGNVGVVLMLV
jgi:hypothetical protein